MYEVKLKNNKLFKSKYLNEVCEFINKNITEEKYNESKCINVKCIRNYIQRNKNPVYITELTKTDIKEYLNNELINVCGSDYTEMRTEQSVNRRMRMIYDNIKDREFGECECK